MQGIIPPASPRVRIAPPIGLGLRLGLDSHRPRFPERHETEAEAETETEAETEADWGG